MNTIWLMVFFNLHSNAITGALEFSSRETCEMAATQMTDAANTYRSVISPNFRKPLCIQVKK